MAETTLRNRQLGGGWRKHGDYVGEIKRIGFIMFVYNVVMRTQRAMRMLLNVMKAAESDTPSMLATNVLQLSVTQHCSHL